MNVPEPNFKVLYNGKNITADISKYMLSITYNDKTKGESDEVEIELEDVDALWQNAWYPEKGANLDVTMGDLRCGIFQIDEIEVKGPPSTVLIRGMATGITNSLRTKKSDAHENKTIRQIAQKVAQNNELTLIDSTKKTNTSGGGFIDYSVEIESMISISNGIDRALVSGVLQVMQMLPSALRTLDLTADSLSKKKQLVMASDIRSSIGLIQGSAANNPNSAVILLKAFSKRIRGYVPVLKSAKIPIPISTSVTSQLDIVIGRVTQNKESDLAFLNRVSNEYGIIFSVREKSLVFISIFDLDKRSASLSLDVTDLISYSIKDKADGMVKSASVKSKNIKKNESVETDLAFEQYKKENPDFTSPPVTNGDSEVVSTRTENKQQAEAKAKAVMHTSASNQFEGTMDMEGNPLMCAGNNFQLSGVGVLSGKYNIKSSSHKIDRSGGYLTSVEVKRLKVPAKAQQSTKKTIKKKQQPNSVWVSKSKNFNPDINLENKIIVKGI